MPIYGLHSFLPMVKRSVAVTEHHVAASYWAEMLAWYYGHGASVDIM